MTYPCRCLQIPFCLRVAASRVLIEIWWLPIYTIDRFFEKLSSISNRRLQAGGFGKKLPRLFKNAKCL
jgi:hypothetical protein